MFNIKKIMEDFDREKHGNRYCKKIDCDCYYWMGVGCDEACGQDDYIQARYDSILKRRLKKLKEIKDEFSNCENKEKKIAVACATTIQKAKELFPTIGSIVEKLKLLPYQDAQGDKLEDNLAFFALEEMAKLEKK